VAGDVMRRAADATHPPRGGSTVTARPEARADRARRLVYRGRFAVLYILLAVVAGAAIGGLVVLVEREAPAPSEAWSEWQPIGGPERRAVQIADHVTDAYRLPSGKQLVTVNYAGPPTIASPDGSSLQVSAVAVEAAATAAKVDDINTFSAGSTVMYILCGLGDACTIREGQPTAARDALLRREALELALYSLTYIDGVDSVLVLLPPARPDGQAATSVFLDRSDVRAALKQPLTETLPAPLAPGVGEMTADELQAVNRLTRSHVYVYRPLQAQDGSFLMVLAPALT
jgi:hypothetical protein